ncbi:uncharacterized protein PAC_13507 [Phialocephala subalpina]|uniref:Xylanolytic transcriptional activator regulatory domain-containing protein n=1 Tax=Phialocephala subalpina TaxID=576137 RepID=A0A1L7XEZ0_9HELO|nr:uncharacterized protein PAC_13507 [Phialocephala subalpina]
MLPSLPIDMESLPKEKRTSCDGFRPACTWCTASQKDCVYAGTVETRKRKQFDAEYLSVLEEQVSTLRAQVADLQHTQIVLPSQESDVPPPTTSKLSDLSRPLRSSEVVSLRTESSEEDSSMLQLDQVPQQTNRVAELSLSSTAIDDLSALVWRMNIGEKGKPTFIGPSGNFCVPSSADGLADRSGARRAPQMDLGHPIPDVCYDLAIKTRLCSLFFSQLNPIHQFLSPSVQLAPDLYPFDDLSWTILHSAIFAAGALFSTVEEDRDAGKEFATCIDISSVQACREQPSLLMVQALSITAWRELSLEHNSSASIYLSMAGGLAVDLGLHVIGLDALSESKSSRTLLAEEREIRLRSFWAFFLVDRIAATMLGRNCIIPWRRVEVPLLHSDLHHSASVDEVVFSHQCRLWQLHDNFMDQIYSFEFKALQFIHRNRLLLSARAELLAFKQHMPSLLHLPTSSSNTKPPRSILFLHMSYQTSLLLIHRPYLREPPESSSFTLALATMSSAATRITQYTQVFYKHYLQHKSGVEPTPVLPFIIHHVLTASIMHLLLATARTSARISVARRNLQICMNVLSALEPTWPIASKAIAQIQELAVQWNIVGALPLKWSFVGIEESGSRDSATNPFEDLSGFQNRSVSDAATAVPESCQGGNSTTSQFRTGTDEGQPFSAIQQHDGLIGGLWTASSQVDSSTLVDDTPGVNDFDFSAEGQEPNDPFDSIQNHNTDTSWLEPQFLPDPSALQDVFDFPEFNIPP